MSQSVSGFRRAVRGAASEAELQLLSELDRETLSGERLRVTLIAVLCGLNCLFFLTMYLFFHDRIVLFTEHRDLTLRVTGVMGLLTLYELVLLRYYTRAIAGEAPVRLGTVRYLNALVETSIPTLLTYFFIGAMGSSQGLLMPPSTLYFFFITLSALRLDFRLCAFTGVVSAAEYLLLWNYASALPGSAEVPVMLLTPFHHVAKAALLLVCGFLAGVVTLQLKRRVVRSLRLIAERNHVTTMFGQYVSPGVVDRLLQQPTELAGELRTVCVLFLDIRNFTRFAEQRSPLEVVAYLNELFSFMIEIINKHNGFINKFLGDGFMALFGAPLSDGRDCEHAARAAIEIVEALRAAVAAGRLPETRIGIGLHAGPALTGSIGSHTRKEYTIIGDTVNLASRIEQLTKEHGAQILVSHSVAEALDKLPIHKERLGSVTVRGRSAPLDLFKLA